MKTLIALIAAVCFVGVALGQPPSQPPKPGPEYKAFEVWIGDWQYEGQAQDSPIGPGGKFSGKATCRWILDGFFMEWRAKEKGNLGDLETIEFDWYDAAAKNYPWQGYISNGDTYSATTTVSGPVWSTSGIQIHQGVQYKTRQVTTFAADGRSYTWKAEISPDGKSWARWVEGKATKVASANATVERASNVGEAQTDSLRPPPEAKVMEVFNGDWTYVGEVKESPLGPAGQVSGKFTVRWILNGFFQEWKTIEKGVSGVSEWFEIDWFDASTKTYLYQGFQSNGDTFSGSSSETANVWFYSNTTVHNGIPYKVKGLITFAEDGMSWTNKTYISTDAKTWKPLGEFKNTKVRSVK